jgi:hypothetical protein
MARGCDRGVWEQEHSVMTVEQPPRSKDFLGDSDTQPSERPATGAHVIAKTDDPETSAPPGLAANEGRIVTGVYDSEQSAEAARRALIHGGFDDSAIVIADQPAGTAPEYDASQTAAGAGLKTGVISGAVVGALLGVLAMVVPSMRAMLPIDPLLALVFAAVLGAVFGGLIGSIAGLGGRSAQAARFEQATRAGGTTVAVRVANAQEAQQAEQLLRAAHAREVLGFQEAL